MVLLGEPVLPGLQLRFLGGRDFLRLGHLRLEPVAAALKSAARFVSRRLLIGNLVSTTKAFEPS